MLNTSVFPVRNRSNRRMISMNTQSDIFSSRFHRGLLSAVFLIGMMLPGTACCCSSQSGSKCCLGDSLQDCCCCDRCGETEMACCCHQPQSSNPSLPDFCCCVERPTTDGIVAQHQRIELTRQPSLWLAVAPLNDSSIPSLTQAIRTDARCLRDPCAHNLRQAILCAWRN